MDFMRLGAASGEAPDNVATHTTQSAGVVLPAEPSLPVSSYGLAERLINATLADRRTLEIVAGRSTVHENGFLKIPLTRDPACSIRLHVWQTTEKHQWAENVHDHRFAFRSLVLTGSLEHRSWSRSPDGEPQSRFHYCPGDDPGSYRLVYTGEEGIAPGEALLVGEGQEYAMQRDELHQVRALELGTVTLLVEDRRTLSAFATVFSSRYDRMIEGIQPSILSQGECAILLESTREQISRRPLSPLPLPSV